MSIYYGTQSDIRVKGYGRLNLLRASVIHFERLDILRDSIRHPSKNLLSFEFAQGFGIPFRAFRYITGLNQTSEQKGYCQLNLLRASTFNFEGLDILRDKFRPPNKKLSSFELAQRFHIQFRASRYITGLNQTSEQKGYCHLNLLRASTFNFELFDILRISVSHPSKMIIVV